MLKIILFIFLFYSVNFPAFAIEAPCIPNIKIKEALNGDYFNKNKTIQDYLLKSNQKPKGGLRLFIFKLCDTYPTRNSAFHQFNIFVVLQNVSKRNIEISNLFLFGSGTNKEDNLILLLKKDYKLLLSQSLYQKITKKQAEEIKKKKLNSPGIKKYLPPVRSFFTETEMLLNSAISYTTTIKPKGFFVSFPDFYHDIISLFFQIKSYGLYPSNIEDVFSDTQAATYQIQVIYNSQIPQISSKGKLQRVWTGNLISNELIFHTQYRPPPPLPSIPQDDSEGFIE